MACIVAAQAVARQKKLVCVCLTKQKNKAPRTKSMTIDSSWLHAFKEEAPHAFGARHPFAPRAIFVDGQIKLMQGFQREPLTWDQFIHRQFSRHLQRCFDGCDVVILAFDNYEHVPKAKCMTQAKRRKHTPALPFSEQSELPCMVPEGEQWTQCIANRTFKARVIDLVLLRLPQVLLTGGADHAKKRLIVDYGEPLLYQYSAEERRVVCAPFEAGMRALGEADIKFTRYADRFKKLMVDSIDGDSVPIALLHFEKRLRVQADPPQISIYRMQLNAPCASVGTKRRADEGQAAEAGSVTLRQTAATKKKRVYEYVNIPALYDALISVRLRAHPERAKAECARTAGDQAMHGASGHADAPGARDGDAGGADRPDGHGLLAEPAAAERQDGAQFPARHLARTDGGVRSSGDGAARARGDGHAGGAPVQDQISQAGAARPRAGGDPGGAAEVQAGAADQGLAAFGGPGAVHGAEHELVAGLLEPRRRRDPRPDPAGIRIPHAAVRGHRLRRLTCILNLRYTQLPAHAPVQ